MIVKELQPLCGRKRQHPANQGQINAVVGIIRQWRWKIGLCFIRQATLCHEA